MTEEEFGTTIMEIAATQHAALQRSPDQVSGQHKVAAQSGFRRCSKHSVMLERWGLCWGQ